MLYEERPPFFVGSLKDMEDLYNILNQQHKEDFNTSLDSPMEFYTNAWKYRPKIYKVTHDIDVLM